MKRNVVVRSMVYAVIAAGAVLLISQPASTQLPAMGLAVVKPVYTSLGVASLGTAGSAAWLLDASGNRVVVCVHGAASGCTRYELP